MMKSFFNNFFSDECLTYISDNRIDFTLAQNQETLTVEQQQFLENQMGPLKAVTIRQIHTSNVVIVKGPSAPQRYVLDRADALVTNMPQLALMIRTADCLPVFLYDNKHKSIGLVHAGWRGTKEKIVGQTIQKMKETFDARPEDLKIAFGPALGACCYQVGNEFQSYFPREVVKNEKGFYFDLPGANIRQLKELGIHAKQIFDSGICTHCNDQYFSHRRQGEYAGRMVSLMMIS